MTVEQNAQELRARFLSLTPDGNIVDRFLDVTPSGYLPYSPRLGLVVIGPETFAMGLGSALVHRIVRDGFQILAARVRFLTPEDTSAMFVPNWIPERYRWWMIQRRFTAGPSAALLVSADGEPDCGAALSRIKGNRIPIKASPGTWRADFPSLNGVLDLVHTADDFCHLLRNASPFYTPADVAETLGQVVTGDVRTTQPAVRELLGLYDSIGACRPFEMVLLQVIGRLLTGNPNAAGEPFRSVVRTLARVRAEHERQVAMVRLRGSVSRRPIERTVGMRDALSVVREYADPLPKTDPLRMLSRLEDAPTVPWDRVLRQLSIDGVVADAWEELVLLTTLYYTDQELPHLLGLASGADHPMSNLPVGAPASRISAQGVTIRS